VGDEEKRALAAALERLGTPLAVRSSASDEDIAGRSAAGQYETVLGVRTLRELVDAVERCYRSAESERVLAYRGRAQTALALVFQREVPATRAGVAFSVDPLGGDRANVVLEVVFGPGERLVSGAVDPDRYWVSRDLARVRSRLAEKPDVPARRRFSRTLRDDEAVQVAELVLRAEDGFELPVDVEFCFHGPAVWLVQCRPITTLDAAR
ncbi:MAG: PEP/pyruvate-binding domain-containing protein, partial [Actinomycetota bacterium]|nr:PEP/pyruvate-binding domain-containing protein [Actinomycetota bacterium]